MVIIFYTQKHLNLKISKNIFYYNLDVLLVTNPACSQDNKLVSRYNQHDSFLTVHNKLLTPLHKKILHSRCKKEKHFALLLTQFL